MAKNKLRIMFVSNNHNYVFKGHERGLIAIVHYISLKEKVKTLGKRELFNFYGEYKKFKPDIIVTSWIPAGLIPLFFKKIGLVKVPIIHMWDDYYSEMLEKYPKFWIRFLENWTIKNSNFITTVSKYNEKKAKNLGKKVFYIPHGVNKLVKKSDINLDKLVTDKGNLKVIYLGEQSKYKRVDEIILAVRGKKCDLFLFGETNRAFIKNAPKNVHFMGQRDTREVNDLLKQADVLVNTSNQDCNFKLFEYINAGKAILGYDGRTNLLLKHKENAYLTKNFEEGVKDLIANKALRNKVSKNVKKIKTFSWKEIADKHLNNIKKVISQKD